MQQLDRDRKQYNLASTYFLDTAKGSHTLQGRRRDAEGAVVGRPRTRAAAARATSSSVYANGVSSQVIFGLPTATCVVGSLAAHDCLTSQSALDHIGAFLNDTWSVGRTTMNLGVRWDRYNGWNSRAGSDRRHGRPRVACRRTHFDETDLYTWNVFAPRVGVVFDLDRRRQDRAQGQLRPLLAQPGRRHLAERQPEHRQQVGDLHLERPGGLRRLHQRRPALAARRRGGRRDRAGAAGRHPAQPGHQGADLARSQRVGRAPAHRDDGRARRLRLQDRRRPDHRTTISSSAASSAYTVPFTFVDSGVDGVLRHRRRSRPSRCSASRPRTRRSSRRRST